MSSKPRSKKGTWFQAFGSLSLALVIYLTIRWLLIEAFVIPSGSMLPTLLIHDYIFVNKMAYGVRAPFTEDWLLRFHGPRRGDVIVFRSLHDPDYFLIKRVVGIPGDTIQYTAKGKLIINGKTIKEDPVSPSHLKWGFPEPDLTRAKVQKEFELTQEHLGHQTHYTWLNLTAEHQTFGPVKVPPGELFMMGDNRDDSLDSRYWGFLPRNHVLGKAMFVWLSCGATEPGSNTVCDPNTIRWSRIFHWIK